MRVTGCCSGSAGRATASSTPSTADDAGRFATHSIFWCRRFQGNLNAGVFAKRCQARRRRCGAHHSLRSQLRTAATYISAYSAEGGRVDSMSDDMNADDLKDASAPPVCRSRLSRIASPVTVETSLLGSPKKKSSARSTMGMAATAARPRMRPQRRRGVILASLCSRRRGKCSDRRVHGQTGCRHDVGGG